MAVSGYLMAFVRHGTRCAGEVAAQADNGICSAGVAYDAGIGGELWYKLSPISTLVHLLWNITDSLLDSFHCCNELPFSVIF